MNLIVDINIFRFFISSKLPSPYKNKLIRLLLITVEEKVGKFSKSFMRVAWVGYRNARAHPRFFEGKYQTSKKAIAPYNVDPT